MEVLTVSGVQGVVTTTAVRRGVVVLQVRGGETPGHRATREGF